MSKRMDKYEQTSSKDVVPKRSEKNKELYKQIYNAYDEFENLVVPSNAKEIDINDLKKEISSRDEYRQAKDVESITNTRIKRIDEEDTIEDRTEETKQNDTVYDINELLDKAVSSNKKEVTIEPTLSSGDYLKKLKLDRTKTNLEQVKEMYSSMEEDIDNNDELIKTASLSLEILSDLKGNDDNTAVSAIEADELDDIIAKVDSKDESEDSSSKEEDDTEDEDYDFYSTNYRFSKKDFEGKKEDNIDKKLLKKKKVEEDEDEDDDEEEEEYEENGHSFLKIFLLIFGILLVVAIVVYLIFYFGKN